MTRRAYCTVDWADSFWSSVHSDDTASTRCMDERDIRTSGMEEEDRKKINFFFFDKNRRKYDTFEQCVCLTWSHYKVYNGFEYTRGNISEVDVLGRTFVVVVLVFQFRYMESNFEGFNGSISINIASCSIIFF